MSEQNTERFQRYWRANKRLIGALIVVWGVVSLGAGVLFVDTLNTITLFSIPLGFWIAQQGAIYVFVVLIFAYAVLMDRIDHRYHADED